MRALADPTRRSIFERIARSDEMSVIELTRGSGVTQGAISQHLKTLKQASLVAERPEGRKVYYRVRPDALRPLAEWMRTYERFWTDRLNILDQLLREDDARKSPTAKKRKSR